MILSVSSRGVCVCVRGAGRPEETHIVKDRGLCVCMCVCVRGTGRPEETHIVMDRGHPARRLQTKLHDLQWSGARLIS